MILPSNVGGATTAQVGYFRAPLATLASWIVENSDEAWSQRSASVRTVEDAVSLLEPGGQISRYLCISVGSWTALLSNGPLGTDVGLLPSYAARELGCRTIRAVNYGDDTPYPARLLEVYGPDGQPPLAMERSITAANDGGRWVFETTGAAYPFEDLSAYGRRAKPQRFTSDMMHGYLIALGVPVDDDADWAGALLVERVN